MEDFNGFTAYFPVAEDKQEAAEAHAADVDAGFTPDVKTELEKYGVLFARLATHREKGKVHGFVVCTLYRGSQERYARFFYEKIPDVFRRVAQLQDEDFCNEDEFMRWVTSYQLHGTENKPFVGSAVEGISVRW